MGTDSFVILKRWPSYRVRTYVENSLLYKFTLSSWPYMYRTPIRSSPGESSTHRTDLVLRQSVYDNVLLFSDLPLSRRACARED